jgi:hypothetical protein
LPAAGFQGTAGRNTLIGPPFRRADLAVSRRFEIGAANLEVRGEIFNVLNTTNFGNPAANISNANVGVISSADEARYLQLGFRMRW